MKVQLMLMELMFIRQILKLHYGNMIWLVVTNIVKCHRSQVF